jgi:hypothetical protein
MVVQNGFDLAKGKGHHLGKMSSTPPRININTSSRSCTGWQCCCSAPYGFGEGRKQICHQYGPTGEAKPEDIKEFYEKQNYVAKALREVCSPRQ